MLRKIFIGTMLLAAMMVSVGQAQTNSPSGYMGNTAEALINAELSLPISVTTFPQSISFGGFMPGASEGTVVIQPVQQGTRSATGGVTLVASRAGWSGVLGVMGEPDAGYQLTFTNGEVVLAGPAQAAMTMTNITAATADAQFKLNSEGFQEVWFGGTLHVGIGQATGSYQGTFEITASYL